MFFFFFFNDTATTEIFTLSLHDALPIYGDQQYTYRKFAERVNRLASRLRSSGLEKQDRVAFLRRSEEHTSELQSRLHLVCRLLLEKKKKKTKHDISVDHTSYTTIRTAST